MAINLECKVGTGAYASVWRATDTFGRTVAVKILRRSGSFYSDALEHAKALARVKHKNVVTVYCIESVVDPEHHEESEAIVMEFIDGKTLGERLIDGNIPRRELISLSIGIIDGLESIHLSGLTHNDLHQENIIISNSGEIKIIDILRETSLSKLSDGSQKARINRDKSQLTSIIYDILQKSDLSMQSIDNFRVKLVTELSFEQIREHVRRLAQVETLGDSNPIRVNLAEHEAPLRWYRTKFRDPDSYRIACISKENRTYKIYNKDGGVIHLIVISATERTAVLNYMLYVDQLIDFLIMRKDVTNIEAILVLDAKPSKKLDMHRLEQALRSKIYSNRLLVFLTVGYIQSDLIFTEISSTALGPIY